MLALSRQQRRYILPLCNRLARSLPYATFISPNAGELMSIADEVRRAAGRPLLPRPRRVSSLGGEEQQGAAGGELKLGQGSPLVELLQQLAAFAEVVLQQGWRGFDWLCGWKGFKLRSFIASMANPRNLRAASRQAPGSTPYSADNILCHILAMPY